MSDTFDHESDAYDELLKAIEGKMNILTLTNEQVSHALTLFMGRCWHEIKEDYDIFIGGFPIKCLVCGKEWYSLSLTSNFPNSDFFSPAIFITELKPWIEKEKPELWDDYLQYIAEGIWNNWGENGSILDNCLLYVEILNNQLNPRNLLQFLWNTKEIVPKLKAPWWEYLEGIEVKK
jgi:hypothetical protein